jgi:uncharacterized membrane protein YphA (DoxX/SURF4 family)
VNTLSPRPYAPADPSALIVVEVVMSNDARAKNTVAPLVLRLALAVIFIYHGLTKVAGAGNDLGSAWATKLWEQQANPPAELKAKLDRLEAVPPGASEEEVLAAHERVTPIRMAVNRLYAEDAPRLPDPLQFTAVQIAVAWGELLGGIALLLGLLTRWAAAGLVIIQLGAIYVVTGARGFSSLEASGFEYNLALIAMCLALILLGSGGWAVNRLLRPRAGAKETKPAAAPA